MKQIRIISFTDGGKRLAGRLVRICEQICDDVNACSGQKGGVSVSDWTKEHFVQGGALIYVGAAGIAVRSIAPHVSSKLTDPAVLVIDEKGDYVVPLLSGHIGEANQLAEVIAHAIHAQAVLTTATDVNDLFAVDIFAKRNRMKILSMEAAKEFSAGLLKSEEATMVIPVEFTPFVELPEKSPKELKITDRVEDGGKQSVVISPRRLETSQRSGQVQLIPRNLIVGIGCRKGKSYVELLEFLRDVLLQEQLYPEAICAIASIDLKKSERGIVRLAGHFKIPFVTFSAQELNAQEGEFTQSAFVSETVGVDNVCERAVMAAGAQQLLVRKQAQNGMTIAIGVGRSVVKF
ncbi:MAG: cobalamin biosynthesis protein [Lachnospiraceae bacterium]|nr:cobalamin biosynthesis protein [Lachnospiraceae bacterium]